MLTPLLLIALAGAPRTVSSPNGKSSVAETHVVCPTKNEDARLAYNEGTELEKVGKVPEARAAYERAIALDPKYCDAMDNLGLSHRHAGQLDAAIGWYRKSIAVQPKNATARMNLGAALRMNNDLAGAAAAYAELVKALPKNPEGHYGLGSVLLEQGKPKDAIAPMLEAEKLYLAEASPYVGDARLVLAKTYYALEDWEPAAKYLAHVHQGLPNHRDVNLMLGTALARAKKPAQAKPHLAKAKELGATLPADLAELAGP